MHKPSAAVRRVPTRKSASPEKQEEGESKVEQEEFVAAIPRVIKKSTTDDAKVAKPRVREVTLSLDDNNNKTARVLARPAIEGISREDLANWVTKFLVEKKELTIKDNNKDYSAIYLVAPHGKNQYLIHLVEQRFVDILIKEEVVLFGDSKQAVQVRFMRPPEDYPTFTLRVPTITVDLTDKLKSWLKEHFQVDPLDIVACHTRTPTLVRTGDYQIVFPRGVLPDWGVEAPTRNGVVASLVINGKKFFIRAEPRTARLYPDQKRAAQNVRSVMRFNRFLTHYK